MKDGQPENDLGHMGSVSNSLVSEVLSWALNVNEANITYQIGKPTYQEIVQWIDEGRPILYSHPYDHKWHAKVIDAYDTSGELVSVIDPWGPTESWESYDTLAVDRVWVPPADCSPRSDEPTIWMDSDGDGVYDFDEEVRFKTNKYTPDSDCDGIDDKTEIRSYTFLSNDTFDTYDVRVPDTDGDGLRNELDIDSDNGGCPDGLEDLDKDGRLDLGETDPFNPEDDPVIQYPTATFTYQPQIPWTNETVTFNATQSFSPNGNITSYEWNFDDGNITTVTEPFINHAYTEPGHYSVTLRVTDEEELSNSTSLMVNVTYRTDLNKDLEVNILDIATVARAYGTEPGDPNWNVMADLDDNKKIDILDIATVAMDYGKTS